MSLLQLHNSSSCMFVDPSRPADPIPGGGHGGSGAILNPGYNPEPPTRDRIYWLWYAVNMFLVAVCLALNALLSTVLIVERQRTMKFPSKEDDEIEEEDETEISIR
ncbi:hypothetical protein Aduo_011773 [Ancylostoma duodenale]